jgi:tetratricopeptide (TPR) repeat protein
VKEKIEVVEEVQKLIYSFSEHNLTQEEEEICLHIWQKLARKKTLEITRTRPDIWASAVIWSFCRVNFKYEESITLDVVCNYFNTKKSTSGNKAGEIIKMLKIAYFSPEFSTRKIQELNPLNELAAEISVDVEDEQQVVSPVQALDPKRKKAVETLDKGLDLLETGKEEQAGILFFESTEIDPGYADGYNHLANIVWRKGDWTQAEILYRKASTLAELEIKDIPRGQFWGILESRPYMRALHGLGLTLWKLNRLEEAYSIFSKMLKLNSNDNQGIRYLMGPILHQMGQIEKAAIWYKSNLEDPHNIYNYGLILVQQKELETAINILISAIFENPYIAPLLLKDKILVSDWWHSSKLSEPEYADEYVSEYRSWWEMETSALGLLRVIWNHGEVQWTLKNYIAMRREAIKTHDSGLITASLSLIEAGKIKRLAQKIYRQLLNDNTGQMKLI